MRQTVKVILIFFFSTIQYFACSGLYVSDGQVKIFGLNEDFYDYNTIYRTLPGNGQTYGIIGFGHSGSIQAIINEKGLIYDGYGAPEKEITLNNHLPPNNGTFIFNAMTTCETIEEVVNLYNQNYQPWLSNGQAFFADSYGNSCIIEGDTILHKTGDYQICTNFYQSDPESGIPYGFYPCPRYDLMKRELDNTEDYTTGFVKDLLDSVHVENQASPHGPISSVYSLVIDQAERKIHVVNLYDFANPVTLDIDEELNKGQQSKVLSSLFPTNVTEEDNKELNYHLWQNYPNPFNPETKIRFSVGAGHQENVTINIFDLSGKKVQTLIDEEKPVGEYEVSWNAAGLSTGVYFCVLKAGKYRESRKLLLLK